MIFSLTIKAGGCIFYLSYQEIFFVKVNISPIDFDRNCQLAKQE